MKLWIVGARPRTLPAAVVPVLVGLACAVGESPGRGAPGSIPWWRLVLAAVVALALQVGTNYANDYSDGVKGTDNERVGPLRLVASGSKPARAVKMAALLSFGIAAAAGAALAAAASWWLIAVGAAAIAAGWFYTGGPRPYGYAGFGEVFVFVFFGVVATVGTTFVLRERLTRLAFAASVPVGLVICALLVINNLRDIPTDRASGKHTLAVRMGDPATRWLYQLLYFAAALGVIVVALLDRPAALIGLGGLATALPAVAAVQRGASGPDLIRVLGMTGRSQLIFGAVFAAGIALSG